MSAIGTIFVTTAAAVGAVAAVKAIKRRVRRARDLTQKKNGQEAVLDLEVDKHSGVWRYADSSR